METYFSATRNFGGYVISMCVFVGESVFCSCIVVVYNIRERNVLFAFYEKKNTDTKYRY
jgi:hypothetical protein